MITSFKSEIQRKLIHLSSLIYPILYHFVDNYTMSSLLIFLFCIVFFWDLLRINNINFKLLSFLFKFLRPSEINNKKFCGATWFMLSFALVVIFFPKYIAILAMCVLIICDTCAALIGKKFGRIQFFEKSLEGFLAFIVSALILCYGYIYIMNINFNTKINIYLLVAILFSAIIELLSKKIYLDDNLTITLLFASILNLGL